MSRAETSIKKQISDMTLLNQLNDEYLDTVGTETVERKGTVRSMRHAMRRSIADAGSGNLYVNTLDGQMLKAISALTGAATASDMILAVKGVVTGSATSFSESSPDADISSRSLKHFLSDVTVLKSNGHFYIDDFGVTTLFRPAVVKDLKKGLRKVIQDNGDGTFRLSTLTGDAVSAIVALTAPFTAAKILAAIDSIVVDTSTSATTLIDETTRPSVSARQIFQKTLRKVGGDNRVVRVDNVGRDADVAGLRYSNRKMLYDALSTDGSNLNTVSGDALAAIALLDEGTASFADIHAAVAAAV